MITKYEWMVILEMKVLGTITSEQFSMLSSADKLDWTSGIPQVLIPPDPEIVNADTVPANPNIASPGAN